MDGSPKSASDVLRMGVPKCGDAMEKRGVESADGLVKGIFPPMFILTALMPLPTESDRLMGGMGEGT